MDIINQPISFVSEFLSSYGWLSVGVVCALCMLWSYVVKGRVQQYKQWREDAEHHKNPERAEARMRAVQVARERQQTLLREQSEKAEQLKAEREEQKKRENLERLEKYGSKGHKLGANTDFLPLSGGGSTSTYRPQKRSACAKGGCGK